MRILIKWIIILASLTWIVGLLFKDFRQIGDIISDSSPLLLFISLVVGTISLSFNALIFGLLVNDKKDWGIPTPVMCVLYFNSQIIRHLPGRIWGVVYQLTHRATTHIPRSHLVKANLEHSALSLSSAALFFFLLVYLRSSPILIIAMIIIYYLTAYYFYTSEKPANLINQMIQKSKWCRTEQKGLIEPLQPRFALGILTANFLSWIFYIVAWYFLLGAYVKFDLIQTTLVLASYSGAWVIGFISLITPSGLGIRESSFLILAYSFDTPERLAFFAVLVRIWLIFIDLILAFFSFLWANKHARATPSV